MQDNNETMECLRCGTCCTVHQAFVTGEDIERISAFLGITPDEWRREYDDPRWQHSQYNLIRHVKGACVFLTYESGAAACTIQPVKPKCCRDWEPAPDRKECRVGLENAGKKL
jgi:Fe-S-cluster containining protein